MKIHSAKIANIYWQITVAAVMQPFQYDLRSSAAKNSSTIMPTSLLCITKSLHKALPIASKSLNDKQKGLCSRKHCRAMSATPRCWAHFSLAPGCRHTCGLRPGRNTCSHSSRTLQSVVPPANTAKLACTKAWPEAAALKSTAKELSQSLRVEMRTASWPFISGSRQQCCVRKSILSKHHCSTRESVWKSSCSGQNIPALDGPWPAQCHASFHVQNSSVVVRSSSLCMLRSPTNNWPSTCKACKVHNADSSSAKRCDWPSGLAVKCTVPIARMAPLPRSCTCTANTRRGDAGAKGDTDMRNLRMVESLAACKYQRVRHWHFLAPWPWQLRTHGCEQSATNLQRTTAWLPASTKYHTCKVCLETVI